MFMQLVRKQNVCAYGHMCVFNPVPYRSTNINGVYRICKKSTHRLK